MPALAERWSISADRRSLTVQLRPSVAFHDGKPVDATVVRDILMKALPQYLGPAVDDIADIRAVSSRTIELLLRRPSAFVADGLSVPISEPGADAMGTGPFYVSGQSGDVLELRANEAIIGAGLFLIAS